jgi:hypothetical protein
VIHLDESFIAGLISTPDPLWVCDDAVIEADTANFYIANIRTTDLLYEMGLREDDIPYTINGMPLASYGDAIDAFEELYLEGKTEYELYVERGGSYVALEYEIDG